MFWHEKIRVEFGRLVPSGGIRRPLSLALMAPAFGVAVFAGVAFSLSPARLAKSDPAMSASEVAGHKDLKGGAADPSADVTVPSSPAVGPHESGNGCSDQTWPYLDSNCLTGTDRKVEGIRVISLTASEPSPATPVWGNDIATGLGHQAHEKPQKMKPVKKPKREREVYNNTGATYAGSYWANQERANRDRW
jgi:hypothetical protein